MSRIGGKQQHPLARKVAGHAHGGDAGKRCLAHAALAGKEDKLHLRRGRLSRMQHGRSAERAPADGEYRPLTDRLCVVPELREQLLPAHLLRLQPDSPHRAWNLNAGQQPLDLELLGRSGGHAGGAIALQMELIHDQLRDRHLPALQLPE